MAEERGWFDFTAVAQGIHEKLQRRHPHVFAGAQLAAEDLVRVWEEQKAQERAQRRRPRAGSAVLLAGVPQGAARARPARRNSGGARRGSALIGRMRAGARQGARGVARARCGGRGAQAPMRPASAVAEELGDVLFSLVNWSRHLQVDPEEALRAANAKFERRFERMESLARARALELESLSAAQWDALWREAKLNGS